MTYFDLSKINLVYRDVLKALESWLVTAFWHL